MKVEDICSGWLDGTIEAIKDTPLCSLFKKYNSDKKSGGSRGSNHNYSNFYYAVFKKLITDNPINYFELGLGSRNEEFIGGSSTGAVGGSLFAVNDFLNPVINDNRYKHGNIFGADIDGTIKIDHPNIKTFQCDQTCPKSINSLWGNEELQDIEFDLIIEDGLHTLEANIHFAEHSLHKLKPGGIFIVEDCACRATILGMYTKSEMQQLGLVRGAWHHYPTITEFSEQHDLRLNTVIKTYQSPIWVMQRNF
tara:strand:- start:524 stop:1276 length:753 start_codon:yes stop_codon:yes gene_type:complete